MALDQYRESLGRPAGRVVFTAAHFSYLGRSDIVMGDSIKAFISYKWEGEAHNRWVEQFAADLRGAGIDALLDRWEVGLGASFTEYMTSKISEADVVLFVITTASVKAVEATGPKGGAIKFELQLATARRTAGDRMRLIGIYREGAGPPAHLRDHRYADFRVDSCYRENLSELIDDILGVTRKPPLGPRTRALSPDELVIAELQEQYSDAESNWYYFNYKHMDDHGVSYTAEISQFRQKMIEIKNRLLELGVDIRDKLRAIGIYDV